MPIKANLSKFLSNNKEEISDVTEEDKIESVKPKRGRPPKPKNIEIKVEEPAKEKAKQGRKPKPKDVVVKSISQPIYIKLEAADLKPIDEPDEHIKEPHRQTTKFNLMPPDKVHRNTKAAVEDLLSKYRKDDLIAVFIELLSWEEFLLCLSNICTYKAIDFDQKRKTKKDELWRNRARYFHDAIDFNGIPGCEY